jgi:hypothetical protein
MLRPWSAPTVTPLAANRATRGRRDASATQARATAARTSEIARYAAVPPDLTTRRSVALAMLVGSPAAPAGGALGIVQADRAAGQKRRPLAFLVRAAPALPGEAIAIEHAGLPSGSPCATTVKGTARQADSRNATTSAFMSAPPCERVTGDSAVDGAERRRREELARADSKRRDDSVRSASVAVRLAVRLDASV